MVDIFILLMPGIESNLGFIFVGLPIVMAELVAPQHVEIASGFFVFAFGVAALLGLPSAGTCQ